MKRAASNTLPLVRAVMPLLRTRRFGHAMEGYASLGSTNTRGAAWSEAGAAEGSVVLAEYQSAGRGRHGRSWQASAGHNLTFSVVLRPALASERLGLISLAAGVAVAEAVEAFTAPRTPAIKWPNDVLLEDRKCCGVLLESAFAGRRLPGAVVLGIGLNVNQAAFPKGFPTPPTSLLLETGRHVPRAPLLARLLWHLEERYDTLFEDGGRAVRRAYEARLSHLGERILLRHTGTDQVIRGVFDGITATGTLRLRTEAGSLRLFHAGEVTTRPL